MQKITTRARLAAMALIAADTELTTEQVTAVVDGAALLIEAGDPVSADVLLALVCPSETARAAHTALARDSTAYSP